MVIIVLILLIMMMMISCILSTKFRVVGVLGQDSVAVPDPAVEDGNINHARVLILFLVMEEEIASVTDLYHIVATQNAVQVRSHIHTETNKRVSFSYKTPLTVINITI